MPMGLYIGIQPGENFVGLGLYEPQPDQLKAIRQEIDYNFEAWQKIVEAPDFKTYFGTVQGERLKTTPKGYEATNPALHWLQLKQFYVGHTLSEKELMAPNIVAHLGKVFDAAQPLCQFLADAVASV